MNTSILKMARQDFKHLLRYQELNTTTDKALAAKIAAVYDLNNPRTKAAYQALLSSNK